MPLLDPFKKSTKHIIFAYETKLRAITDAFFSPKHARMGGEEEIDICKENIIHVMVMIRYDYLPNKSLKSRYNNWT